MCTRLCKPRPRRDVNTSRDGLNTIDGDFSLLPRRFNPDRFLWDISPARTSRRPERDHIHQMRNDSLNVWWIRRPAVTSLCAGRRGRAEAKQRARLTMESPSLSLSLWLALCRSTAAAAEARRRRRRATMHDDHYQHHGVVSWERPRALWQRPTSGRAPSGATVSTARQSTSRPGGRRPTV